MTELTVQDLHVTLGKNHILKGVSMEIKRGEIVALLGPSGSGKTTLLRSIAGLELPTQGMIRISDQVVYDSADKIEVPVERRSLGFVFQSYALWPHRTVFENVAYGLKLRKVPKEEIRERVQEVLKNLGLGDLGDRFPHQLSGGQQQRVALARSLVYKPQVILLDEPLSNLDAKLREEARIWLRQLIIDLNLSAVCVTHDQAEAMAMADKIVLLKDGMIEQAGTPQQMYGAPDSLFVAEFMGANNTINGLVTDVDGDSASVKGEGWSLRGRLRAPLKAGDRTTAIVRLEKIKLAQTPKENSLRLPLTASLYLGNAWEYVFDLSGTTIRGYGNDFMPPGEQLVDIPAEHLWLF
ncbi:MAG: ABC transporter ATP-binding protein [Desulfuromonadaceae bacterium]|nr:ABC transporter ATP-binding protein [Desulfuromonadaceae bacterium]